MSFKLFGYEPHVIAGLGAALLGLLVSLNLPYLSAEQAAGISVAVAALYGVVAAVTSKPTSVAVISSAVSAAVPAVFGLVALYGVAVDPEVVTQVSSLALAVVAFLAANRATPEETTVSRATGFPVARQ